ncbi:hypothetical protein HGRIS_000634 [Hohenbuehelia grisea]|uniref:RGS domain-containing protein n=1 Tax=Hohenbuehelia grisea TaxID=104357 RepID=A0ABR3JTI8_9AGAR
MSAPHDTNPLSSMLNMTMAGRPFHESLIELFGTLMISLNLSTHKQLFRNFENTFTVEEACANLESIAFAHCRRVVSKPSSTRCYKFSMQPEVARRMLQCMLDCRYIESASEPTVIKLKEKGLYTPASKGLHVLERWVAQMGVVEYNTLPKLLETHPICVKLVHIQRQPITNGLIFTPHILHALFRRFVGARPNYMQRRDKGDDSAWAKHNARSKGIPVKDFKQNRRQHKACFTAATAHDWMCEFMAIDGPEEAVEIGAHFVSLRLLTLVSCIEDENMTEFRLEGEDGVEAKWIASTGAVYCVSEVGRVVARWEADVTGMLSSLDLGYSKSSSSSDLGSSPSLRSIRNLSASALSSRNNHSSSSLSTASTQVSIGTDSTRVEDGGGTSSPRSIKGTSRRAASLRGSRTDVSSSASSAAGSPPPVPALPANMLSSATAESPDAADSSSTTTSPSITSAVTSSNTTPSLHTRESNATRLLYILNQPRLRALFRDFLRESWCEENLSFWLDVGDFAKCWSMTTSVHRENREPTIWKPARPRDWPGYNPAHDHSADGLPYIPTADQEHQYTQLQSSLLTHRHNLWLVRRGFAIYNTHLAESSETQLSMDSRLNGELVRYVQRVLTKYANRRAGPPGQDDTPQLQVPMPRELTHRQESAFGVEELHGLIEQFNKIRRSVFTTMSLDSVPKFTETPAYIAALRQLEFDDAVPEFRFLRPSDLLPPHPSTVSTTDDRTVRAENIQVSADDNFEGIYISTSLLAGESRAGQYL